ncbi:hypothetical protein CkaCkLH20_10454 [Colletotrichum karsti]|uniref:Wax synthase domain-containing protein n=1 Tax=Colletotrichum karsti TaxID=1095194 RepID=A0A9P6LH37_9PEZI|nr:uncharacterized protein CkaCkLH20_10454 [Colletotrichum karsti]KAF9872117.1 hypothetical protein CkaCkLH20_10454 [Colletotrichum karsti]
MMTNASIMATNYLPPISALKPALLFTASATVTTIALHFPPKSHHLFLAPAWLLAACSLLSVDGENPSAPTGLDSYTAITSFLFLFILPTILLGQSRLQAPSPNKKTKTPGFTRPSRQSILAACAIWNNPRHLPSPRTTSTTWPRRISFAIHRAAKATRILLFDRWVIQRIRASLPADMLDFTPDKHALIRPLFYHLLTSCTYTSCPHPVLTTHQLQLRAFTVFSWLWSNYALLQKYHAILSVTFVLLGADDPDHWPPLFGSPADAWTVQGFWGKFWHRIASPTFIGFTRRVLGMKNDPRTMLEKLAVAFGVFCMSGVMHMAAAWRTGEGFTHLDLFFFCANFFAVVAEVVVMRVIFGLMKMAGSGPRVEGRLRRLGRGLGYVWVFAWFFWATPRWLYPKIMRGLIKKALMEDRLGA